MRDDLKAIWDQMQSDFEAIMLAFSTQAKATGKMQTAVDDMQTAIQAMRGTVEAQNQTLQAQGAALGSIQRGMRELFGLVDTYYTDHERRLLILEGRQPA